MSIVILNPDDALLHPKLIEVEGNPTTYVWVDSSVSGDDSYELFEALNDNEAFEKDGPLHRFVVAVEEERKAFMEDEGEAIEDEDERVEAWDRWKESGPGTHWMLDGGTEIYLDDYDRWPSIASKKTTAEIRGESLLQIEDIDDAFGIGRDDTEFLSEAITGHEQEEHLVELLAAYEPTFELGTLSVYGMPHKWDDPADHEDTVIFIKENSRIAATKYYRKKDFDMFVSLYQSLMIDDE